MKVCPICGKKYQMENTCPICKMPLVNQQQSNRFETEGRRQEENNQKNSEIKHRPILKNNYPSYENMNNSEDKKKITISQSTLIGAMITIVCLVLVIIFLKHFSEQNNNNISNNTNISQNGEQANNNNENNEGNISDTTEETDDTDTESQEEEGMTLPYTDNEYMAPGSCLSEADFASVTSEDGSFKFCYPKYIFNTFYYDEEQGEYYFAYKEDGTDICSLRVYKDYNPYDNMIDAAKNLRYRFNSSYGIPNYYWPTEDLSKLTSDSNSSYAEPRKDGISRYVMSGWTSSDRSQIVYCLGANDGANDYILEFSYPDYDVDNDMEEFDYITECIYRDCSFSGTSYAVRSYDTYMSEGFKEGHH